MAGSEKAALGPYLARNPFGHGLTDGLFYREKMRAIHRIAPQRLTDTIHARVLEIGGGRSGLTALLYPAAQVVSVDLDASLLRESRGAGSGICADACRLPFANASFDAVTLFDVLEHVPDDAAAVREAQRVTRPGGWILLSTPNADWRYPWYGFMRPVCPHESELMREWGHVRRGYETASLEHLFGQEPQCRASFINSLTAFAHDVAFSRLGRRKRKLLYAAAAPLTLLGYALHRPTTRGTETAYAWRRA